MALDTKNLSESGITNPAAKAEEITPADTDLTRFTRAIYVGGEGNLVVLMGAEQASAPITFANVPAGSLLPIRAAQIRAATTATQIVALF